MDELIKALRYSIVRDAIFILGGTMVFTSFSVYYSHDFHQSLWNGDLSLAAYILGAGLAYVVAYVIHGALSLTPFLTVAFNPFGANGPGRVLKFVYRLFQGHEWVLTDKQLSDLSRAKHEFYDNASNFHMGILERHLALKQVSTVMGSCAIVSAVPLILHACKTRLSFDITLAILIPTAGAALILLGWIKTLQRLKLVIEWYEFYKSPSQP